MRRFMYLPWFGEWYLLRHYYVPEDRVDIVPHDTAYLGW